MMNIMNFAWNFLFVSNNVYLSVSKKLNFVDQELY